MEISWFSVWIVADQEFAPGFFWIAVAGCLPGITVFHNACIRLTKRGVDALSVPLSETVVRDRNLPSFGTRVYAAGRKVWCVQTRERGGNPKRVRLGRFKPTGSGCFTIAPLGSQDTIALAK